MGLGAALTGAIAAIGEAFGTAGAAIATGIGLEGATLGGVGAGALIGGALEGATIGGLGGGLVNAIQGKPILAGIGEGALVGGSVGGLGPAIGGATGLGATAGDVLAGAGSGALGGAVIPGAGGPLEGALGGAAAGLTAGAFGGIGEAPTPTEGSAFGNISSDAAISAPTIAPGVQTTGTGIAPVASSAVSAPTVGPGPGAAAFSPPSGSVGAALDPTAVGAQSGSFADTAGSLGAPLSPTDTANFTSFQANVPAGTNAIGADVISPTQDVLTQGAAGTLPGQTGTAASVQPELDTLSAEGGLPGGSPPAPPGEGGLFSGIGGAIKDAGNFLNSGSGKLISSGISGIGLAKNLLTPPNLPTINLGSIPGVSDLQGVASSLGGNVANAGSVAAQAQGQGQVLESYLTTGTLPPAIQASLDQATHDAELKIKASYAQRGMPPGSSSEIADINALKQNAAVQGGNLAASLFDKGIGLDQLSAQIYNQLVGASSNAAGTLTQAGVGTATTNANLITNENNALNQSIANLSSALGGGTRIINAGTALPA